MNGYATGFRTDVGRQRSVNEDAGEAFDLPGGAVAFVICDGMGGMHAGEVAAQEAVRVVRERMTARFSQADVDPIPVLDEAFRAANDSVNARNRAEQVAKRAAASENEGEPTAAEATLDPRALMGTTCVAGMIRDDVLYLAHVGDSRAYRWRRGQFQRLTEDHSFVGERVKAGDMTEEEAKKSRFRNIVTRGIGIEETVEPEFRREEIEAGELILICTDGLTTMVEDAEIAGLLYAPSLRTATPERISEALVEAANRRGGSDNITVLAIRAPGAAPPMIQTAQRRLHDADEDSTQEMTQTRENAGAGRGFSTATLIPMLLGAGLMLLLLLVLLALARPLRERLLGGAMPSAGIAPGEATPAPSFLTPVTAINYAALTYDKPVAFSDQLARGDLLTYARGVGLYFVAGSSGNVRRIDPMGTPGKPIETLEMVGSEANKTIPETQIYITSDPQGNVYIAYTKRRVIVKKAMDGRTLTTLSGFDRPEAIAVDESGNIFVVDLNQIKICRAHALPARSAPPAEPVSAATPAPSPSTTPPPAPSPSASASSGKTSSGKATKPIRSTGSN